MVLHGVSMNKRFYSGIGSRDTPNHICILMSEIAEILECNGYILRSGGAKGADIAFENGVKLNKEIFYTDHYKINDGDVNDYSQEDYNFALDIFKKYHPIANKLSGSPKDLLVRNTFQFFGVGDTKNVDFVICYTPDGAETSTSKESGGSGQLIRIANAYNTKVYNLKNYIGVSAKEMVKFILNEVDK